MTEKTMEIILCRTVEYSVSLVIHPKSNSNIAQLKYNKFGKFAKVKVLQNLIVSRVELSFQNSKDLVDQSDLVSPSSDDFLYQY